MIKFSHLISEMSKFALQIRLFMTFMFHLMLWKTLRKQYIKLLSSAWFSHRNDSYNPYFKYA